MADPSPSAHDPRTPAGVAHLARLSRLHLEPAEAEAMVEHLTKVLAWVEQLDAVDTAGVSPSLHDELLTPSRADAPQPSLSREAALGNAPARSADGAGFAVPAVLAE